MMSALQFVAIAGFLMWGLLSSLCDVWARDDDDALLVSLDSGPGSRRS